MTDNELIAINAAALPSPPIPDRMGEAEFLAEAKRRHDEKAAATTIHAERPRENFQDALDRLQKLGNLPPTHEPDPRLTQAARLFEAANVPLRHRHRIPVTADGWNQRLAVITSKLGTGSMMALAGPQGTGKTQFGAALIYAATDKLIRAKYAVSMDFFMLLKTSYDERSKTSEAAIIQEFTRPKLLVLDEMDERSESPWENRLLFHMLNQRYNDMTDTLLISRRPADEFQASLGVSLQSRIQESGCFAEFNWPSFRENFQTKPKNNT